MTLAVVRIAAVLVLLSGCTPLTRYRRSAMTPSPSAPPWHGEPLGATHLELGAQVGGRVVDERWNPQVGDPALHIPEVEVNATVGLYRPPGCAGGVYCATVLGVLVPSIQASSPVVASARHRSLSVPTKESP